MSAPIHEPLPVTTTTRRAIVSEVFGPTIQGEGPLSGRVASFVRLGLCNLDCINCDTPYTWDWSGRTGRVYDRAVELVSMTVDDVVSVVASHGTDVVVISGGEPLVQRSNLHELAHRLVDLGKTVQVETNGTLDPGDDPIVDRIVWVVSPKGDAMQTTADPIRLDVLARFSNLKDAHLKIVCASAQHVDDAAVLVDRIGWDRERAWIMPEGVDRDVVALRLAELTDAAVRNGLNVTTRLHVLAWGNVRGR